VRACIFIVFAIFSTLDSTIKPVIIKGVTMQRETIGWLGNKFFTKHSDEAARSRLLRDLKHHPDFVVEVVREQVGSLVEEWSREFSGRVIHITNDDNTPDAFGACAKRVVEYLRTHLQEELAGISD